MKFQNFIIVLLIFSTTCRVSKVLSQQNFTYQKKNFETGKIHYLDNDTITYVFCKSEFNSNKPNLLFIQGSLPRPILFDMYDTTTIITPLSNFKINRLTDNFNVFVLSKPFTPLRKKISELNYQYLYVPNLKDSNSMDTNYQKTNYLEYTAKRISFFVDFISENHKTKDTGVVLIGHSQGAVEAARVASINSKINYCATLSTSIIGRIQGQLLENRNNFMHQKIDSAEYNLVKTHSYEFWKFSIDTPDYVSSFGDPSRTLLSFSNSLIPDFIQTDAKVFYGVGGLDVGAIIVDLIPIYFIEVKKEVPTIKIYEGLNHDFFPIKPDGTPDYFEGKWGDVMNDILDWIENEN